MTDLGFELHGHYKTLRDTFLTLLKWTEESRNSIKSPLVLPLRAGSGRDNFGHMGK
jgi:hypothetical protein